MTLSSSPSSFLLLFSISYFLSQSSSFLVGAVNAANWLHMALALFGMTVVSSFFGHLGAKSQKKYDFILTNFACSSPISAESVLKEIELPQAILEGKKVKPQ